MVGIYKITSPSGKVYIGQSWNIEKRKNYYAKLDCKGQTALYNSLLKHGWSKHSFTILHELPPDVSQKILNDYEFFYHSQYQYCGISMLNLREPGSRGKLSPEAKEKISKTLKGRILSDETKSKMSLAQIGNKKGLGRHHSEESKEKMRVKLTGRIISEATRQKIRDSKKNLTDENRKNMSEAQKGKTPWNKGKRYKNKNK